MIRAAVRPRLPLLLILLAAVALMAPELALGLSLSDSFRYNLVWTEQFAALFRDGHLYPRWLPLSWHGLGSPTFYFYPPLFFWVTALIDTATGGLLPAERFTPLGTLALLAASGAAMYAWLRAHAAERPTLLGAFAYMAAPYHVYDIYGRGALAEASAYAAVPLIALGLKRLAEGRARYLPLLATGYAALLLSHLPSALLVSVFLIPPYVIFEARRSAAPVRFLALALAGGLLGIGVAGIYLVPALRLLPYASAEVLSANFYRPENWFLWPPRGSHMVLIGPMMIAELLLAAGAAAVAWRKGGEALFWPVLAIVLLLLVAGVVPSVWSLPGLKLVQFPWRALLLVEFAVVNAFVIAAPSLRKALVLGGIGMLAFAYTVLGMLISHVIGITYDRQSSAAAAIRGEYRDAPEYLPAGTPVVQGSGPEPVRVALPGMSHARAVDPRARVAATAAPDGGMTLFVQSPAPSAIILPRFYFPHWVVRDVSGQLLPVKATNPGRLVAFEAPAGRSTFRLSPGRAPFERLGAFASLIALLLLGGVAAKKIRRSLPLAVRMGGDEPDA